MNCNDPPSSRKSHGELHFYFYKYIDFQYVQCLYCWIRNIVCCALLYLVVIMRYSYSTLACEDGLI